MKRLYIFMLVGLFIISLTGCKSGFKLEEGQSSTIIDKDGKITMSVYLSDKDLNESYGLDFEDDKDEIEEAIIEMFDEFYGTDIEITKFKKGKDNVQFTMVTEDGDFFGYDLDNTLEDYAEASFYENVEELADSEDFVNFKDGKDLDKEKVEKYEDAIAIYVYGDEEGSYFKMPNKILFVDENLEYEKKSSDTIFIEDGSSGVVVFKEK